MNRNTILVIAVIVVVALVAVTFPLWRPIFVDEVVDEPFPNTGETVELTEADMNAALDEMMDQFPEDQREVLNTMRDENVEMAVETANAMMEEDTEVSEDMPDEPTSLAAGQFIRIDAIHAAEGTATIYELPDASRVLRFEDFTSTNGPDLHVLLAAAEDPRSRADLGEDYIDLGQLKGNVGNQNYDIPEDVDLSQYNSVVIYCMPFSVVFSVATLG